MIADICCWGLSFCSAHYGAAYPPRTGDYFVFSRDAGGSEFLQNYRFDVATGETTLLTDGKSRNSLGIWSTAGDRLAYTSTRRTGKDNDIYVIDPRHPRSNRLLTPVEGGGWFLSDWSPDDRQLLVGQSISANESYLWLVDAQTGAKTLLTPKGKQPVRYGGGIFSKDGKGLYVVSDRESEFQRLAYLELAQPKGASEDRASGERVNQRYHDLTNAAKIKIPLFVVHGQNDPRVPLSEAEQIVHTVRNHGTPVWYLMAKDEGHGFAKKPNIDYQFYATVRFIQKYLLGQK